MEDKPTMRSIATEIEAETTENTAPVEQVNNPTEPNETATPTSGQATTPVAVQPEENFATSFDPKTLAPELLPVYKSMQGDYTRKTQEIAEVRKRAEEYAKVKPLVDKLMSDQKMLDMVLGIKQAEPTTPTEPEIPDDPKAFADFVKNQALEEMRREREEMIRQERFEQARERDIAEAEKSDPRLTSDPYFQKAIAGIVSNDPLFRTGQKTATQATKEAIAEYDAYIQNESIKRQEELVALAKQRKNVIPDSGSTPISTATGGAKTMRDAWRLAQEEIN